MKTYDELLQIASGHVLTEHLPDDFGSMSKEDQDEFITDHSTFAMEHWYPDSIWAEIESFADELNRLQKDIIKELQNDT